MGNVDYIGTHNNVECTFTRDDLTVSSFLRTIPDVRHLDGDMCQYSEHKELGRKNKMGFEYLMEAKFEFTTNMGLKNTNMIRFEAQKFDCYAVLVQHFPLDDEHNLPITVTVWSPGKYWGHEGTRHDDISWETFAGMLKDIHEDMMIRRGLV